MRIVLTTCAAHPSLTASDALLAAELQARGHEVEAVPWNGAEPRDWSSDDLVVLRSNWDYHRHIDRYETWLVAVDRSTARLVNPCDLVRWNCRKTYLLELGRRGAPIPATWIADAASPTSRPEWIDPARPVVAKPVVGASGDGVALVDPADLDRAIDESGGPDGLVIQEFVTDVGGGEWSLVFLASEYSHAFQRVRTAGEAAADVAYRGIVQAATPDRGLVALAGDLLGLLPTTPVYARVDLLSSARGPLVIELEVNEPSLRLDLHPDAPARFADALLSHD
ncbi:MAG: ATP-grasp domain-containing protein [Actinomycetota bacterium]